MNIPTDVPRPAIGLLEDLDSAIVLLDIGMPQVDGFETCRRMHSIKGVGICIVGLTGRAWTIAGKRSQSGSLHM